MLEAARYHYQKFLSDIAGQDIRQHGNQPRKAVGAVRDWLAASRAERHPVLPGAIAIMKHYGEFQRVLPTMLKVIQVTARELEFFDRAKLMGQFVKRRPRQVV